MRIEYGSVTGQETTDHDGLEGHSGALAATRSKSRVSTTEHTEFTEGSLTIDGLSSVPFRIFRGSGLSPS
jgi:hypothetical protein